MSHQKCFNSNMQDQSSSDLKQRKKSEGAGGRCCNCNTMTRSFNITCHTNISCFCLALTQRLCDGIDLCVCVCVSSRLPSFSHSPLHTDISTYRVEEAKLWELQDFSNVTQNITESNHRGGNKRIGPQEF